MALPKLAEEIITKAQERYQEQMIQRYAPGGQKFNVEPGTLRSPTEEDQLPVRISEDIQLLMGIDLAKPGVHDAFAVTKTADGGKTFKKVHVGAWKHLDKPNTNNDSFIRPPNETELAINEAAKELKERFEATKYAGPHPTHVHVCRLMTLMSLWRKSDERHKFERLRAEQIISPDRLTAWECDMNEWRFLMEHLNKVPHTVAVYDELTLKGFTRQLELVRELFKNPDKDPPPAQDLFFIDRWLKTPMRSGKH